MFMMGGERCGSVIGNSVRHKSAVCVVYMKFHSLFSRKLSVVVFITLGN